MKTTSNINKTKRLKTFPFKIISLAKGINLSVLLLIPMFFAIQMAGQNSLEQDQLPAWGIFINPTHAFSEWGELQLGVEHPFKPAVIGKLGLGFRYRGSEDPNLDVYLTEDFIGLETLPCSGSYISLIIIAIPINSSCDDLEGLKVTETTELYIKNNFFLNASMKFFSTEADGKPRPAFFEAGLMIGSRSYIEYFTQDGSNYKNSQLVWQQADPSSSTFQARYELERYAYHNTTKKTISEPYLIPYGSVGTRLKLGKRFTIEGSASVYFGKKITELDKGAKGRILLNAQVGMWLF